MKRLFSVFVGSLLIITGFFIGNGSWEVQAKGLNNLQKLGEHLYFDENLSNPPGQSCASCHDPNFGFVDPDSELPVSEGVNAELFGGRNSPSAAYAMYAPMWNEAEWIGGQFWDGRSTGEILGDPLADQALGPFLNPVEMANTKEGVVGAVELSNYAKLFKKIWGANSFDNVEAAYDKIALSIAAFERSSLFAPFSSKYDKYLKICINDGGDKDDCAQGVGPIAESAGLSKLSALEWEGLQLFMGENNNDGIMEAGEGAMCVACHVVDWTPNLGNVIVPDWSPMGLVPPMFTDFTYDNLGVPRNDEYPLGSGFDEGLGPRVGPEGIGLFKVMTLRNIGLTGPYAHNGLFESLKEITNFYNTRDVGTWIPEYTPTMNREELGNLGLSSDDEDALVAFMQTLTDK